MNAEWRYCKPTEHQYPCFSCCSVGSPHNRQSPDAAAIPTTPTLASSPFAPHSLTPFEDDLPGVSTEGQVPMPEGTGQARLQGSGPNPIQPASPSPASPMQRGFHQGSPRSGELPPTAGGTSGGLRDAVRGACEGLQRQLLQERARSAALDLQVRALCAELSRAADVTGGSGQFGKRDF
jgi:hypothetical protein